MFKREERQREGEEKRREEKKNKNQSRHNVHAVMSGRMKEREETVVI